MSRNWTPREMYFVDLHIQEKEDRSLRSIPNNLVFVGTTGERIPFYAEEELKILGMFKELGFLFGDNLYHLWVSTNEHPRIRKKVLMWAEEELEKILEADKNDKPFDMFDETLVAWYMGKLDSHFYYSDYNNKYFEEYLYDKIMKK